jgi:hypothetical protein
LAKIKLRLWRESSENGNFESAGRRLSGISPH